MVPMIHPHTVSDVAAAFVILTARSAEIARCGVDPRNQAGQEGKRPPESGAAEVPGLHGVPVGVV